ncbi:MAG TPA: TadE/TadG family type IV pilus assembly protein [Allosphingosinicella sp.]|nr:TadE/TadG family type IV pilus assembly protein [Allosphingosinicella sp.]
MTRRLFPRLRSDRRGISAVEFGLLAPVFIGLIIGIGQVGILFQAQAGLRHAVQEGARYATLYVPNSTGKKMRPTDAQIIAKVTSSEYGLNSANITGPSITTGTSNGATYLDITMSYSVPLNFVFYSPPAITLSETRRAFVQS